VSRLAPSCLLLAAWLSACGEGGAPVVEPDEPDPLEALGGGDTTNRLLFGSNAFTLPAANLDAASKAAFFTGNSFFNLAWVAAPSSTTARDGVGPIFNARSCSTCHFKDGRGRPPLDETEPLEGLLLRLSIPGTGPHGAPVPDPVYGGQFQPFALPDVPAEGKVRIRYDEVPGTFADSETYSLRRPRYELVDLAYGPLDPQVRLSPRVAPAMIGLGLLEAVPEDEIVARVDENLAVGDGIVGKVNRVWDSTAGEVRIGRFGWKAEEPSVRQQSAGAFQGDMGITSSLAPTEPCTSAQSECLDSPSGGEPEIDDESFDKVVLYSQTLAVPERAGWNEPQVLRGRALFREASCSRCHVPRHRTGEHEVAALSHQVIWPYTDLLLHDMGEDLSDDRPVFGATGREWRTPPLWGIGRVRQVNRHELFLHDGRARGFAEAILWHGGEAEGAREAFRHMPKDDRAALIAFLESL